MEYRNINPGKADKIVNAKFSKHRFHKFLKQIKINESIWDFDAVSLYSSAMWDEKSIRPCLETGYAFTKDMNDNLVEKFNNGNFNQGIANFENRYRNPPKLFVQHFPVKEKVKKIEVSRLGNGYILDILTNVDIHDIPIIGGKVVEIYEGVIYREKPKVSPFRKVIDKLFALRSKYNDEGFVVLQLLVKLLMTSLYGEQICKDIQEKFAFKSDCWLMIEYVERNRDF